MKTIDLEYKYRIDTPFGADMVPFRVAVLSTVYPSLCINRHDEPSPAEPKSHLCPDCKRELARCFRRIADEWDNLQDALAANSRAASAERVGGTRDPREGPVPINMDVSNTMGLARSAVWSTVGQLLQDRPDLRLPADHSTDVLADWVARRYIDYLASHPSAGHLRSVFLDVTNAAQSVMIDVLDSRPVEVEMRHSHCHQFTDDTAGGRVPCPGQLVGVLLADGRKVVKCDADPLHLIPADAWFQVQNRRAPRPARSINTLMKKYARRNA
jgi:hypothetical protein